VPPPDVVFVMTPEEIVSGAAFVGEANAVMAWPVSAVRLAARAPLGFAVGSYLRAARCGT
jgi:hypothetical protein